MKWHPDKCGGGDQTSAKLKFQEIQEAYTVLSDAHKKALYDSGLYDPDNDDEDVEGLVDFISEMSGMMAEVQASEDGKGTSFQELQQLFVDIFSVDAGMARFNAASTRPAPRMQFDKKRSWGGPQETSWVDGIGTCIVDGMFNSHDTHIFLTKTLDGINADANVTKKKKSTPKECVTSRVPM